MNNQELSNFYILLSNKSRFLGVLKLEEAVQLVDDQFIKLALALIVDGTDPELVMKTLTIRQDTMLVNQKIRLDMIKTLTSSIHHGDNPRITTVLGKSYCEDGFKV
jgi:flagellar motor component MotA